MKGTCVNCGKPIEAVGKDYRGDPFWRHVNGTSQCQIFARPKGDTETTEL